MRNVDGDERDVGFAVLRGDRRRHRLVGLKLDHEIHAVADQELGVLQRDLRLVAVVDDDDVDALAFGGTHQAVVHFASK